MTELRQIQWAAGLTTDGAVGVPGIFTTRLENVFLDDQKQPILRQAIEFLNAWAVDAGEFMRCEISYVRQWIYVAHVSGMTCTITIVNLKTLQVYSVPIVSTTNIYQVFFTEVEAVTLNSTINLVTGVSAILICGLGTMYYLDDSTKTTAKTFKIKTTQVAAGEDVIRPNDSTLFQSRLAILCYGPYLVAGQNQYQTKHRVLFSTSDQVDNFVPVGSGATVIQLKKNPIDAIIISDVDEEFYALTSSEDLLIITTSKGLRIIKSGDDQDKYLQSTNIMNYVGGWGNTKRCRAMQFAGFLIFACTFTLRAKMLQSLETDYINTIDLVLPILASFNSQIRDITMDYNTQNLQVFCVDGTIWNTAPQSMIPSKSYNLSLPVMNSFKTDGLEFLFQSSLNPSYTLVRNYNANGQLFYSLLRREYDFNRYGYLADGATEFAWNFKATSVTSNSFVVDWYLYDWAPILNTGNIIGMWLCFEPGISRWVFYATDFESYPKFTTSVGGITLNDSGEYVGMLVVSDNGYETLIGCFAQENAVMEMNFDWTGETDGVKYEYTYFHQGPIGAFGMVQDMPTDQIYTGTTICYIAIGAPTMAIGWRDTGCVDNLSNRGGIRCVLLSDSNNISDYVEFYTSNYSVAIQVGEDSTEVEFHTNMDASYTEKTIKARTSQFLESDKDQRFTYLIGQY